MHADEFCAIRQRHAWGSTEKILRRNRRGWVRLGNKRRRQGDRRTIDETFAEQGL